MSGLLTFLPSSFILYISKTTLALLAHQGGLWSSWSTLVHPGPPGPHFFEKLEKFGSGRIKLDQEDHGDHDPPWWTRSVQDLGGPPSNILLMFLIPCLLHTSLSMKSSVAPESFMA